MGLLPALAALALVLTGVAVLLRRGPAGASRSLFAVLLLPAAVFGIGAALERPDVPESRVPDRPIESRPPEFVSSRACEACHPHEYATWDASYHQSMTQVASPSTIRGTFDGVELRQGGWEFRLERRGDEFWVDMPELDWSRQGPAGPRVQRKIVLATGSHHMQAYWYASGNSRVLGLLPFIYNLQLGRWMTRSASFINPPIHEPGSELGRWNKTCLECHVTLGRLRPFEPNGDDTHVVEFGIACESCHGPAAAHLAANHNPWERYRKHFTTRQDASIVQPERLPHDRSAEVCGQCHSTSIWTSQRAIDDWMKDGFRYRPGDRLADTKAIVRGKLEWNPPEVQAVLRSQPEFLPNTFWADGMNRVTGREYNGLLETPCFQRGEMSCLSCHELHKDDEDPRPVEEWADDQLKPGMRGNLACTQCHATYAEAGRLRAHTHHEVESSGSVCYNCHMPHTTYGLLKAVRSHQVDSPSVQATLATHRPNACNQCHLDRTLSWTAETLRGWYGIAPPALSQDESEVAASVLSLLRGDAGERALAAWSMAWQPALEVSGNDWQGLYLGILLADPYDAVRCVAYRSLGKFPSLAQVEYDFLAPTPELQRAGNRVLAVWHRGRGPGAKRGDEILIDPGGEPRMSKLLLLLHQRDDRPVSFAE
jgi:hypothetical protein